MTGSWPLRFGLDDETNDEPGYFTALFGMEDPVAKRRLLVVAGSISARSASSSFRSARSGARGSQLCARADRKHGYVLVEEIRSSRALDIDLAGCRKAQFGDVPGWRSDPASMARSMVQSFVMTKSPRLGRIRACGRARAQADFPRHGAGPIGKNSMRFWPRLTRPTTSSRRFATGSSMPNSAVK